MHRYIPLIAKWAGFRKVGEKVVEHRPRKYGKSKFGFERYIRGFLDLATIMFLGKFGKRPMQFLDCGAPYSFSLALEFLLTSRYQNSFSTKPA